MRHEEVTHDLTIVGGGLSGVCAAIAAARLGRSVALIQNRPVLGGNSSSEVRVWVGGANGLTHNRYARETGIMGEFLVENQYRNKEGNPYVWDLVLLEAVRAEPNIDLYLNTDVRDVAATGPAEERTITSVTGWMMAAERLITFYSPIFLDCSGDALLGVLAGAEYRAGREARSEFNEIWAPEEADELSLGSTILFYTKDTGRPVPFVRPSFAKDIASTSIPLNRVLSSGESGAAYWWIEFGGELDTIHDDGAIRDELWSAVYGIWDYIKNSGKFNAENLTLEWVGAVPGKRESRRLIGDYILTQNDVIDQVPFHDRVAFGGWMVDLHPTKGMYSTEGASSNMYPDGIFHIPYRSLYSVNVNNLLFAGRNISASHVGFGATRVMATCGVMGEAAGTAAALCIDRQVTPRELGTAHLDVLQRQLLRQDAAVIGLRNEDPADHARTATITASSTQRVIAPAPSGNVVPLTRDIAFLVPVDPHLDGIELVVDAESAGTLHVELWDTERAENYVPHTLVTKDDVTFEAGARRTIRAELPYHPDQPANVCIIVHASEGVALHLADGVHTGTLSYARRTDRIPNQFHVNGSDAYPPPALEWHLRPLAGTPVSFRAFPETAAFAPEKVVNGYTRPYGGPNLWISEPLQTTGGEAWIELAWPDDPRPVSQVAVTFNDDVNEHLNNLHKHETPDRTAPQLVRDYRIELRDETGNWSVAVTEHDNRRRHRVHTLPGTVTADRLRVVVEATHGAPGAEIAEIRAY